MVGSLATLDGITDVAVCPRAPHHVLVATDRGNVHLYTDPATPSGIVWSCHGGNLRVGWAGTRPLAWIADPSSHQLFVLDGDGHVRKQHAIPPNCDVAPCNGGFFVATSQVRLTHFELARDGSCSSEVRQVPAPGSYEAGSLTASQTGAVAVRSGGLVQVQTRPSRPWQDVRAAGAAPALSIDGTRLATVSSHEDGSHIRSFVVSDADVPLETPYAIRALQEVVTGLDWSADNSMLVTHARVEGDVRVFFRDGWVPGLWTASAVRPRFHPAGVITVPRSRDRLLVNDPRGATPRAWARWRSTTPATFIITGNEHMRRGDKIVVFEREPHAHPTSIYEIVGGHRKDDDVRELPTAQSVARLRLGIGSIAESLLDAEATTLSEIENAESGEVQLSTMRSLLERLLADQSDRLDQMRMHLPMFTTEPTSVHSVPHASSRPDLDVAEASAQRDATPPQPATLLPATVPSPTLDVRSVRPEPERRERVAPDWKSQAAAAQVIRNELLEELYGAYMDSPSSFPQYDGRDPNARERAREAEWLKSRGYIKATIGADYFLSLQLTPAGRDHFESTRNGELRATGAQLSGGESPATIGSFVPLPLPATVGSHDTFDTIIGLGVDVLLVTAVDVERDAMMHHLSALDGYGGVVRAPFKEHVYFIGQLGRARAALVMTRMGAGLRDGSTLGVNEAIGACRPRAVIAVGMAWGMSTKLRLADVLVSTHIIPFDVARRQAAGDIYRGPKPEAGALLLNRFRNVTGWKFTRADGRVCEFKDGPMLCGESLVDDLKFKTGLHVEFPDAIGGEMEGTGIYGASAKHRSEWIIVKAICDWADGTKDKRAQPVAAAAAASLVAHVVSEPKTLDDLPRMTASTSAPVQLKPLLPTTAAGRGDTTTASAEPWRVERRATKSAEVAAEASLAALAFIDGLISVVSIFVTPSREPSPDDPMQLGAWREEMAQRWTGFAPISNRFVDAIRLAETHLPDEVNALLNHVWLERADIRAAQQTYFQTPQAGEFFAMGWGSAPTKKLAALRDECRRLLRPIVQLEETPDVCK